MTVFAAVPWTYWLAPAFLSIVAAALLGFGVAFLKKVVEPHYRYMDAVAAARVQRSVGTQAQLARSPGQRRLAA